MKKKRCSKCGKLRDRSKFRVDTGKRYGISCWCKSCTNKHEKKRRKIPSVRESRNKFGKEYRNKQKETVINYYGGKCACCGEKEIMFLTIDHINNDGFKALVRTNIHSWIIRNNFPVNLQVLCWNCNCGKAINKGTCPHEK